MTSRPDADATTERTILSHPAVDRYLRELGEASSPLPPAESAELQDQVRDHLLDALASDATHEEVREVLLQLGPPAEVATAMLPDAGNSGATVKVGDARPRRWRGRIALAAVLLVMICVATFVVVRAKVAAIEPGCQPYAWLTATDAAVSRDSRAGSVDQVLVPARPGHHQVFVFAIYNPSRFSQRVTYTQQPHDYEPYSDVTVSTSYPDGGDVDPALTFRRSVAMPPSSYRLVRFDVIYDCDLGGGDVTDTFESVKFNVRTLGITRTRSSPMPMAGAFRRVLSSGTHRC